MALPPASANLIILPVENGLMRCAVGFGIRYSVRGGKVMAAYLAAQTTVYLESQPSITTAVIGWATEA